MLFHETLDFVRLRCTISSILHVQCSVSTRILIERTLFHFTARELRQYALVFILNDTFFLYVITHMQIR